MFTGPARQAQRLSDLERRVKALEAGSPTIQQIQGNPAGVVRDGTPAVDSITPRLWLRVGGTWRYVGLA